MDLTTIMRRALTADPDELRTRLSQKVYSARNRRASKYSRSVLPQTGHLHSLGINAALLPKWFAERNARWFLTPERREELRDYYQEHELERSLILRRAQTIVEGKMPIFSREPVEFSGADRWRRDFFLNVSAPQVFYGDIEYLNVAQVGDSKHAWEPNRFGWVYWLGQAYTLTGEKQYAETFARLTIDWLQNNPYPLGVNYCSALESAFRCYALVWGLDLFADMFVANPQVLSAMLQVIWQGCAHIENNLSYYFAPNTHLTGEAFALYACGAAVPEFAESERWRALGERILVTESQKQFHCDGAHKELSSCYHLYSTDFYLQTALIAKRAGFAVSAEIYSTAKTLACRLAELAPSDLTLPQFNDCDGGRVSWFAFAPLDAAPTLFSAREMFDEEIELQTDRNPGGYSIWMALDKLPVSVESDEKRTRSQISATEPDSGIVTYRSVRDDFVLARCGPFGYLDCGHSHDAPTSFLYYSCGQPVIVDCGTGSYTQDIETRNRFRFAAGKNVLLLNGRGPSEPDGWFTWKRTTSARLLSAREFEGGFYLKTRHDGYSAALGFAVEVAREIILLDEGLLIVVDNWEAEQEVSASLQLTLAPRLQVTHVGRLLFEEDGSEFHYLISPRLAVGDTDEINEVVSEVAEQEQSEMAEQAGEGDTEDIPEQEWAQDIRFRPRVRNVPFSPDYGIIGETKALVSDFGGARSGFATTILSRLGPARNTNDSERFRIGLDEQERELYVGRSGKIYLSGKKLGTKTAEPVVFAR